MSVHYKFKSTKDFDTVSFDGLHISVADLKKAIFHQKRLGKNTDFDLQITNAQTKEDYTDDNALIAKNTSLIIARIPLTVQQKRSWDRNEPQSFSNSKDESSMGHTVDLTRLDGSEEDKIRAMMTQSTQDYDPSNYMKIRGANQTGEVPPNYRCYKCHQPGHWIKNCPLGATQEPIEIKKSTGIPRSFMVPVEGPLVPGAMMTPTGHYAVPAIDHQAYKEGKKERPPFFQDPEPAVEKPEIPEDLICTICKDLLTDAVMVPCCGNSYCDECIRSSLLESEEHECPGCNEKDVSPETLIPNRYLRGNVLQFNNKTGYAKKTLYRAAVKPPAPTIEAEKFEGSHVEPPQELQKVCPPTEESAPGPIVTDTKESTPVPEILEHVGPLVADEESEAAPPPPPGTEPLLPIPSASKSPEKKSDSTDAHVSERRDHLDDYAGDYGGDYDDYEDGRRPRDRHRSYSKEGHRERTGDGGRRIENIRSMTRRRSLSPRQRQDYQSHGSSHHMMNQPKGYQNMPPGTQRYSNMHYDPQLRRSTEDRPGTPTVDEPHLHSQSAVNQNPLLPYPPGEECIPPPPQQNYTQPPPRMAPHNPPLLPDPYMGHRMPMYSHQQGPHYGPPRYDRPPYQQSGYRSSQPPRNYNGPPRPMRGMHHRGYRGMQPPPPGLGRNMHNGNQPGVIDDPLEAFERMLREKDERDRRMGKHRRRSRTRSRSRSYTRSRSRSFSRRSPPPSRMSRSRSPPPKRRPSRSPPSRRSRTPKRRSRSGSFSISRSRSYSRSQSPRASIPRDRDRERERERDLPPRYTRSPVRSPPRALPRDRERDRDRGRSREPPRDSREQYSSYYNDSPANEYGFRERERDISNRDRGSRYPPRNQTNPHNIPPLLSHAIPPMSMGATQQPERKDYYDSYNRYGGGQNQRFNSPPRDHKRFDDVAPPGTEGYYDLPPPGVDHPERSRDDRDRSRGTKDVEEHGKDGEGEDRLREERVRDRDRDREDRDRRPLERERDREREREKDNRDKTVLREKDDRKEKDRERDDRYPRDRREEERQSDRREYDVTRYREDRDRHRVEEKARGREKDRKDRDYEAEKDRDRHERHSADRKKSKKSSSPHPPKSRSENKESSPERPKKKEKDHDERSEEKRKEKKIKDKKKKKDNEEKEKKKKKKREKKTLRELAKNEHAKVATEPDNFSAEPEQVDTLSELKPAEISEDHGESIEANMPIVSSVTTDFDDKSLTMNPEPPEFPEQDPLQQIDSELSKNPPNPNFKPIPELKSDMKPIDSLYDGLDDTEINAVITEKYSLLPDAENDGKTSNPAESSHNPDNSACSTSISRASPQREEKSPKRDEFLAPLPELSKWERDDTIEKSEENIPVSPQPTETPTDDTKTTKIVTSEVLKRAENAIFQKAINAIRPIEIKKISESRKILYQNPEPKIVEQEANRERKSVNVTINVGRNERNVEITEPIKKGKLDRSKFKSESHSPTRLSAKERLGDKIEDDKEKKPIMRQFVDKKELMKNDDTNRSKSPKVRERKISPLLERRVEPPISLNSDRKVFLEDRKHRSIHSRDGSGSRHEKLEPRDSKSEGKSDFRQGRSDYRSEVRVEKDRRARTPPSYRKEDSKSDSLKRKSEELEPDRKKEKKLREDKKRKKEHRSRSKSRDRKRKKDKKHKKDKEKSTEKKQKHREEKTQPDEEINPTDGNADGESSLSKKQRKNPRLISDRKRSMLDEASFEPDYSASDSDSEGEEGKPVKKPKLEEMPEANEKESEAKVAAKRRIKSSSDDDSSSTESSSSDTDSSEDSHRKRKKKHKKHKKRKTRKDSSSDSDSYSDSSDSSSEEEKHKKKSKKSKGKSKQSKKKKKSKHK